MRILFTHSYFLRLDPKQVAHAQPYPPLATLIAASLMRNNGHEVKVFDTMFARHGDDILPALESFNPDVLVCYDDGFNYLTKMCLTNMREAAFRMMQHAGDRGCTVIASSSDATDHHASYLDRADFVIPGEPEYSLKELADCLSDGKGNVENIAGLIFKNGDKIIRTAPRAVSKNLDALPLPAWELIDITPYRKMWLERHGYFSLNVATTRGCPYKCNWCAKPIYGNAYHMRSPENVIQEISVLKEKINPDHIWFCDDIFGLKRSWVVEFASLMRARGLRIPYKIQSRADLLVQEKYVQALADSGCAEVWMGAESGSQKILDAMDKGTTVDQIREARALLKKHGIPAAFFLQFGYPGEVREDIEKTIELVKEAQPDDIGISVSYPLPGTVFYDRVKSQLGAKTNWTDSDELALMFRNTYRPEFYKTLHRYVHNVYRGVSARRRLQLQPFGFSGLRASATVIKNAILAGIRKRTLSKLAND